MYLEIDRHFSLESSWLAISDYIIFKKKKKKKSLKLTISLVIKINVTQNAHKNGS